MSETSSSKGFYSINQLIELVGASRASIYRWSQAGKFPKIYRIGPMRSGCLKAEVDEWVANIVVSQTEEDTGSESLKLVEGV